MTDLSVEIWSKGRSLPSEISAILADADRAIAAVDDENARRVMAERLALVRQGAFDSIIVRDGQRPIGLIAFRADGTEAVLSFGHLLSGDEREVASILGLSISMLAERGHDSIASTFNWPEHELFAKARPSPVSPASSARIWCAGPVPSSSTSLPRAWPSGHGQPET